MHVLHEVPTAERHGETLVGFNLFFSTVLSGATTSLHEPQSPGICGVPESITGEHSGQRARGHFGLREVGSGNCLWLHPGRLISSQSFPEKQACSFHRGEK